MADTETSATSPTPILMMISERVAALTPEQLKGSEADTDESVVLVGELTDHQQRLYTVMSQAIDDHNKTATEMINLRQETSKNTDPRLVAQMLKKLLSGGPNPEVLEKYEKLRGDLTIKKALCSVLQEIFWLDVRTLYPALADKCCLGIFKGWSVGWREHDEEAAVFEIVIGGAMPDELAAAFGFGPPRRRH